MCLGPGRKREWGEGRWRGEIEVVIIVSKVVLKWR